MYKIETWNYSEMYWDIQLNYLYLDVYDKEYYKFYPLVMKINEGQGSFKADINNNVATEVPSGLSSPDELASLKPGINTVSRVKMFCHKSTFQQKTLVIQDSHKTMSNMTVFNSCPDNQQTHVGCCLRTQ